MCVVFFFVLFFVHSFPSELPLKALFLLLVDMCRYILEIALVSPATLPAHTLVDI